MRKIGIVVVVMALGFLTACGPIRCHGGRPSAWETRGFVPCSGWCWDPDMRGSAKAKKRGVYCLCHRDCRCWMTHDTVLVVKPSAL